MLIKRAETVVICGAGRFGASLAGKLSEHGYGVTIVDKKEDSFRKIPDNFSGYYTVGDATDIDFLQSIGADKASFVIATTNDDNTNSMIGQIAGRLLNVKNVYIRLNDDEKSELVSEFDNIKVISPHSLSLTEFERLSGLTMTD
ncbi:MAG: TrkA family potassium uptake protein [Clostridiales bacterium]|nr:TrkA family potassium uptake protein [Clostridiales bacterium]